MPERLSDISARTAPTVIAPEAYHLEPEAMDTLEAAIVQGVHEISGLESGVVGLVVSGQDPFADFGRTSETLAFDGEGYDFHAGMQPYEADSQFLYTVDLDEGRIAHVKRMVGTKPVAEQVASGLTGLEVIDDRLQATIPEERATLEQMMDSHGITTFDRTWNLTTNLGTARVLPSREKPYSLISYKAVFDMTRRQEIDSIVAYMNAKAVKSLGRLGVEHELVAGKDFHLPLPDDTTAYDPRYIAVYIPSSQRNLDAFTVPNPDNIFSQMIAGKLVPLFFKELVAEPPVLPA